MKVFLLVLVLPLCHGYRHYQDEIPNGDQVPHPCKDNFLWRGVGHNLPGGGGPRNPFGVDFEKTHQWTHDLCMKDSDGDGTTNGEELGDPQCMWTKGNFPQRTKNISHPGICDPFGSPQCHKQNDWVSCDAGVFKCNATKDPDVKNFTLRFPPTIVPPTETNYYCMPFLMENYLDMSKDYHLVASQPQINNTNVMHHILLFGCSDDVELSTEAQPCYMAQRGCSDILGIWTLGLPGTCEYEEAGYLIGRSGHKKMVMQFHWTNPELKSDYVDSSGLTLYYTEKLRKYNAGMLLSGQLYLNIPPGTQRMSFEGSCSSRCTDYMVKNNVFFTSGVAHMHYLGFMQRTEVIRNGQNVVDVIDEPNYSYDSPMVHSYDHPIEFRQGDELRTTCMYRSTSKTRTTLYGEGSYDEMCFSLLTYFPKENMTHSSCHQWKDLDMCVFGMGNGVAEGCDTDMFFNTSSHEMRAMITEVMDSCNHFGPCRPECPEVVRRLRKHPCLHGQVGEFLIDRAAQNRDVELIKFVHAFTSCDRELEEAGQTTIDYRYMYPMSTGANHIGLSMTLLLVMSSLMSLF